MTAISWIMLAIVMGLFAFVAGAIAISKADQKDPEWGLAGTAAVICLVCVGVLIASANQAGVTNCRRDEARQNLARIERGQAPIAFPRFYCT